MACSDLRGYALLKVETDSEKRRALSEISGGLLKAFLYCPDHNERYDGRQTDLLAQRHTLSRKFTLINGKEAVFERIDFIYGVLGKLPILAGNIWA